VVIPNPGVEGDRRVVVYVEDEPDMIKLVRLILEHEGIDLIGVVDAQEGVAVVRTVKPDLILLDLMMPDMDGWEVFEALQADVELKQIPVIVLTVRAAAIDKSMGLYVYSVEDYITKPFEMRELVRRVHKVLGKCPPRASVRGRPQ
jgi:DNA-binding response OmpR family regulator